MGRLLALKERKEPLSKEEADYPSIWEANKASALSGSEQVGSWRKNLVYRKPSGSGGPASVKLQPGGESSPALEEVILLRGSTRRFARKSISFEQLSTVIGASTGDCPLDFLSRGGTLVDFYLTASSVDGLPPGSYFYDTGTQSLVQLRKGEFRGMSAHLGLEQPLFGDASVVFFLIADLEYALGLFGSRGYRAAQFEAGVRAGKIYLSAYSLGIGASGSTFYDDTVTELFSPHAREGKERDNRGRAGCPGVQGPAWQGPRRSTRVPKPQ